MFAKVTLEMFCRVCARALEQRPSARIRKWIVVPYGMEEVEELGSLCALAVGTLPSEDCGEADTTHNQHN